MWNGEAGKSSRVSTLSACALVKSEESPGFWNASGEGAFGGTLLSVLLFAFF